MNRHRMDDAAYKRLFSRPGMVRDLLRGFAARDWSGALDFASLTPLPASYVSRDLRQRHGDLVWRVRFGGERWLYLVLLLEFQSGVDRAMAVRMLTYSGLLYQRLVAEGVLRERGELPPVLPVVIYNGRSPWTVPTDVAERRADPTGTLGARSGRPRSGLPYAASAGVSVASAAWRRRVSTAPTLIRAVSSPSS